MILRRTTAPAIAGALMLLLAAVGTAHAQYTWPHWTRAEASGPGDFLDAANWTTRVPTTTDTFSIDNGGTAVLNIDPNLSRTVFTANLGFGNNKLSGFMNHLSGTLKVTGNFILSAQGNHQAIYTLDGGTVVANPFVYGTTTPGNAAFRHWSGSVQAAALSVGNSFISTYGGTYELGDPDGNATPLLDAGSVYVGTPSLFDQTGGAADIDQYTLRGTHRYTGGALQINHGWLHEGLMDFQDANVNVQIGHALVDLSQGTFANGANASFTSGAKSMVMLPAGFDTNVFGGGWNPGNLTHTVGTTMDIAADGEWWGWGTVNDHVNTAGIIYADGGAVNLMNGLNVTGDGNVNVGTGTVLVEDLTSGMTGGTLTGDYIVAPGGLVTSSNLFIGRAAPGAFTMSGDSAATIGTIRISEEGSGTGSAEGTLSVDGNAVLESISGIWIGFDGNGNYHQSGGSVTTDTFTVGFGKGVTATMTMTAGYLKTGPVRIANDDNSSATVTQSGGHWDCTGSAFMNLASDRGTAATFNLTGDAVLDSAVLTVGNQGAATFNQSGNSVHNIDSDIRLASPAGSYYNMSGGELNVGTSINIYGSGSAAFNHTGGTVNAGEVRAGGSPSSYVTAGFGTYNLTGPGTLVADEVNVGKWINGQFIHAAGTCTVNGPLRVGVERSYYGTLGEGAYELSGTGELSTAETLVGVAGTGTFTQTGGSHAVAGDLIVGRDESGIGTYNMSGGTLNTSNLIIGRDDGNSHGTGTFIVNNAASSITVSTLLHIGLNGNLQAVEGSVIHLTGSHFSNASVDPAAVAGLSNLTLVFEGGPSQLDTFEVAGRDFGTGILGLDDNFALHTLSVGGAQIGMLQLTDLHDNQPGWNGPEALYVQHLILTQGSTLDLGAFNLYYGTFSDQGGTVLSTGGSLLQAAPEPATMGLLALGLAGLVVRRRSGGRWLR